LKSGIYVPMNVFNMCCYCLHHLKIQNDQDKTIDYIVTLCFSWSNRISAHLEQKSTQVRIMGIVSYKWWPLIVLEHRNMTCQL
jgi:hypothetical protein